VQCLPKPPGKGKEKKTNPYLQYKSRHKFIAAILNSLGHVPQYFIHDAALNRKGPELVAWKKLPGKELSVKAVNYKAPLDDWAGMMIVSIFGVLKMMGFG